MKYVMLVVMVLMVVLPGCASFECSIGAGYRKVPPEVSEPILPPLAAMQSLGLSPSQIKLIFDFLLSDSFKVLFPESNRVDVGAWCEIRAKSE